MVLLICRIALRSERRAVIVAFMILSITLQLLTSDSATSVIPVVLSCSVVPFCLGAIRYRFFNGISHSRFIDGQLSDDTRCHAVVLRTWRLCHGPHRGDLVIRLLYFDWRTLQAGAVQRMNKSRQQQIESLFRIMVELPTCAWASTWLPSGRCFPMRWNIRKAQGNSGKALRLAESFMQLNPP